MPGDQFGMLTVLGRDMFDYIRPHDQAHIPMYVCRCSCPNQTIVSVRKDQLLDKRRGTRSCGCLARVSGYKHGYNDTRLYGILDGMKKRCYNMASDMEDHHTYKNHIYICPEWMDPENGVKNFCEWALANGYRDDLTIDRIDNNGPYSPDNCRWVPMEIQANNKTTSVFITIGDTTYTLSQWEAASGINQNTIRSRLVAGYDPKLCVYTPTPTNHDCVNAIYFVDEYNNPINQFDKE